MDNEPAIVILTRYGRSTRDPSWNSSDEPCVNCGQRPNRQVDEIWEILYVLTQEDILSVYRCYDCLTAYHGVNTWHYVKISFEEYTRIDIVTPFLSFIDAGLKPTLEQVDSILSQIPIVPRILKGIDTYHGTPRYMYTDVKHWDDMVQSEKLNFKERFLGKKFSDEGLHRRTGKSAMDFIKTRYIFAKQRLSEAEARYRSYAGTEAYPPVVESQYAALNFASAGDVVFPPPGGIVDYNDGSPNGEHPHALTYIDAIQHHLDYMRAGDVPKALQWHKVSTLFPDCPFKQ